MPITAAQVQALYDEAAAGAISGRAFHDKNGDGAFDAGDAAMGGVTVFLDLDNNGAPDAGEATAVTDAAGDYQFANIAPGIYVVRQVAPSEFAVANGRVATVPSGGVSASNDCANARTVYHGTAGGDDYRLRRNAGGEFEILIAGSLAYTVFAGVPSLTFDLGGGDDRLTVDLAGGAPGPGQRREL